MRAVRTAIISIVLALVGCVPMRTTTVEALVALQTTSSYDPLFYVGSDQRYHYFNRLNVKYTQPFRVPRDAIALDFEFARGTQKSHVM
jgi:hypothetical protein